MKSYFPTILLGLAIITVSCHQNEVPDIDFDIPEEINLQSTNFQAINQSIKTNTTFAELELYNRWGQKVYQSQDKEALISPSKVDRSNNEGPLYYIIKYNLSQTRNELESQTGTLTW